MLPIDSSEWGRFWHMYLDKWPSVPEMLLSLSEARDDEQFRDALSDISESILHQGDLCPATYVVAPHLIHLAKQSPPNWAVDILLLVGDMENARRLRMREERGYEWIADLKSEIVDDYHRALVEFDDIARRVFSQVARDEQPTLSRLAVAILDRHGHSQLAEYICQRAIPLT